MLQRLFLIIHRRLPEQRLFIASGDHVRFVRLTPGKQLTAWIGIGALLTWSVTVTTLIVLDSIGSGNYRAQAVRERSVYMDRLETLAAERDRSAAEAAEAQNRFAAALTQAATLQRELLTSAGRIREAEIGVATVHAGLSRAMRERTAAREALETLTVSQGATVNGPDAENLGTAIDFATRALDETAADRRSWMAEAEKAGELSETLDLEIRLTRERNAGILQQLEDALTVSFEPLDDVFRAAGLDPVELLDAVESGTNGSGQDALVPIQFSTMGTAGYDDETVRANRILDRLDQINLYRIAVDQVPLAMPVRDAFRYTSQFGPRWGRMHKGVDMAGPIGTPIYATADGVVTFAGWMSGFGRIVKVQHGFGFETLYPHLNAIRVDVGQTISQGDRVGDMGNSGRSTGSHLHYEIRVNGEAVNPMPFIEAGGQVF